MWDLGHGGGTILGDPRIIISSRSSSSSDNININSAHHQTYSPQHASGPVSCVVLYPILRMASPLPPVCYCLVACDACTQRPPPLACQARVVAAAVGSGGVLALMISNVGLVQVTTRGNCDESRVTCGVRQVTCGLGWFGLSTNV